MRLAAQEAHAMETASATVEVPTAVEAAIAPTAASSTTTAVASSAVVAVALAATMTPATASAMTVATALQAATAPPLMMVPWSYQHLQHQQQGCQHRQCPPQCGCQQHIRVPVEW
jgi:hypothetical protein